MHSNLPLNFLGKSLLWHLFCWSPAEKTPHRAPAPWMWPSGKAFPTYFFYLKKNSFFYCDAFKTMPVNTEGAPPTGNPAVDPVGTPQGGAPSVLICWWWRFLLIVFVCFFNNKLWAWPHIELAKLPLTTSVESQIKLWYLVHIERPGEGCSLSLINFLKKIIWTFVARFCSCSQQPVSIFFFWLFLVFLKMLFFFWWD